MDYKKMCRLFFIALLIGIVSAFLIMAVALTLGDPSGILAKLFVACGFLLVLIPAFGTGITGALYRQKEFDRTGKLPVIKIIPLLLNK